MPVTVDGKNEEKAKKAASFYPLKGICEQGSWFPLKILAPVGKDLDMEAVWPLQHMQSKTVNVPTVACTNTQTVHESTHTVRTSCKSHLGAGPVADNKIKASMAFGIWLENQGPKSPEGHWVLTNTYRWLNPY